MTIKNKLNLITVLVVSFALIIIFIALNKAISDKATITKSQELNVLSQKQSLVIHETQKERGASAGFIGSQGKQFGDILPKNLITKLNIATFNTSNSITNVSNSTVNNTEIQNIIGDENKWL